MCVLFVCLVWFGGVVWRRSPMLCYPHVHSTRTHTHTHTHGRSHSHTHARACWDSPTLALIALSHTQDGDSPPPRCTQHRASPRWHKIPFTCCCCIPTHGGCWCVLVRGYACVRVCVCVCVCVHACACLPVRCVARYIHTPTHSHTYTHAFSLYLSLSVIT